MQQECQHTTTKLVSNKDNTSVTDTCSDEARNGGNTASSTLYYVIRADFPREASCTVTAQCETRDGGA